MANKIHNQKVRVVWIIIMIAGLILFFLTGCKNYYIVVPDYPEMEVIEKRAENRFSMLFEEADSVFNEKYLR